MELPLPEPGAALPARRVIVLGSTGSVGVQALECVAHLNQLADAGRWSQRFEVVGLAAHSNAPELAAQAEAFGVRHAALTDPASLDRLDAPALSRTEFFTGSDAPSRLVRAVECDLIVAAMVGAAGLEPTLEAVRLGRDIALANKETIVAGGALVVPEALRSGSKLLPVDSEHSGVWQCLLSLVCGGQPCTPPMPAHAAVSRIILTASGGALRSKTRDEIEHATPAEALSHPTWNMGAKNTIDSASLMNKALELIEAHWLFSVPAERLGVLVDPDSLVHALVEFADRSVLAQIAEPDMRSPILHALAFPHRAPGLTKALELDRLVNMRLETLDEERFPAPSLAMRAIREGGTAGAVLNAANEAAVDAFLAGRIRFGRIVELVRSAMDELGSDPVRSLDDVREADGKARAFVEGRIG
ncbi:MAG: 1-deoxy-D-xylulose-5-phosphate reductoisomerase [Phycisphaerales bacterium]|nr:MAG: 1-deoxy-D-xylulose-5-phosphate reductoisomerase [Phycisphaerales bacterium]